MRHLYKILLLNIFMLFFGHLNAQEKISYVDMEQLMNTSEAGKSITSQLTSLHKKTISELKIIEDQLKEDEAEIMKQKNVISQDEFDKKISILRSKAQEYQKKKSRS